MKIKKYIKKNLSLLTILLVVVCGSGLIIFFQNRTISGLQRTINASNDQVAKLSSENASQAAQIKALLTMPTPTPVVKYINTTPPQPSHPDFSTCSRDGDFYYCPSDGCYYTQSGKQGSCKIPGW
jgi:hypothetical protein